GGRAGYRHRQKPEFRPVQPADYAPPGYRPGTRKHSHRGLGRHAGNGRPMLRGYRTGLHGRGSGGGCPRRPATTGTERPPRLGHPDGQGLWTASPPEEHRSIEKASLQPTRKSSIRNGRLQQTIITVDSNKKTGTATAPVFLYPTQ